jgi:transposase
MSAVASRRCTTNEEGGAVITIGIDPHSRTHAAAAVDGHGRVLGELSVGSNPRELDRLARWIAGTGPQRVVAIEGARGFGLALARRLHGSGETVLDVTAAMTVAERRSARRPGKDDRGDAVAIARVAMRENDLPRVVPEQGGTDLKLLVDARDQLVAEATRTRNRLHALLLTIAPGYQEQVRDLTSSIALMVARRLASRARGTDRVRSALACSAIARLRSLGSEIASLEREITASLDEAAPASLLGICGVGPLVAAKILGEVRDVRRFSSPAAFAAYAGTAPVPASSGTVIRHRLHRGGNRQLNRALHTIALTQARRDPRARAFLARKRSEGKTPRGARRALKRHLAVAVYRALALDTQEISASPLT